MVIKNFFIQCWLDGRKKPLVGGPLGEDGGFEMRIFQRNEGEVTCPVVISGEVEGDELVMMVDVDGNALSVRTRR